MFTTAVNTALLGAFLTFARTPWYAAYGATTAAYGLTPLEDQQLGGLVMWIPGGVVYVVAVLVIAARVFRRPPAALAPRVRHGTAATPAIAPAPMGLPSE